MLEKGIKAPDFMLEDKDGNKVSLSSFLGKKVVLYFYPKDPYARMYPAGLRVCRERGSVSVARRRCDRRKQRFGRVSSQVCRQVQSAVYSAVRSGTAGHPGIRCLAGEKALWKACHGCRAHDVHHRRAGDDRKGDDQGQTGDERGRNPRVSGGRPIRCASSYRRPKR